MRILNLYAGLGGNRTLWKDVEVTAIEIDSRIASVYQTRFPNDNVLVMDCIEFVENNDLNQFDFIWASPPCQSHTRIQMTHKGLHQKIFVPDCKSLYGLNLFFQYVYPNVKFVIENVKPFYTPFIPPIVLGRHCFWSNFTIPIKRFEKKWLDEKKNYSYLTIPDLCNLHNIDLSLVNMLGGPWEGSNIKSQVLRNCCDREIGEYILNCAKETIHQIDRYF